MGRFSLSGCVVALVFLVPCRGGAQTPAPLHPAVITSTTSGGVGYVNFSNDSNGLNAQLGRWDTAYSGGLNGPSEPGAEPLGDSTLAVGIDVNDGGTATFDYTYKTWDGGIWDWYDVSLVTPTGTISLLRHLGKPGNDYGTYYESPHVPISVSLNRWRNQHVTVIFSVTQDGWGDQSQGEVIGFNVRTCAVPPLAPLTDPEALRFEAGNTIDTQHLQSSMQTALGCVQTAAAAEGGTVTVSSAYRAPSYQAHLREVWDKWRLLKDKRDPECDELKHIVQSEFAKHGLLPSQRPASPNGPHTQGAAIDMRSSLPTSGFLALTAGCGLTRPLPSTDPVHFTHQ